MEALSSSIVQLLLALLVAVLTLLSGYAVKFIRTKLTFISEGFAQEIVRSGIALAEEAAAVYIRKFGQKMESSAKLRLAVEYTMKKLPGISDAEAQELITAELPKVGLGAAGFLNAVALKMREPEQQ